MRRILALISVTALMVALTAMPVLAQPLFVGGLVNITIIDAVSLEETNVQVPIGVAANVCGVQANVLAQGGIQEPVDCTSSTTAELPVRFQ